MQLEAGVLPGVDIARATKTAHISCGYGTHLSFSCVAEHIAISNPRKKERVEIARHILCATSTLAFSRCLCDRLQCRGLNLISVNFESWGTILNR